MISKQAVEEQLKQIGFNFRLWGRAEVNELGRILLDDEIIAECVNGEYANGFALLVATNHRVLLVDKKPMLYLTVEDLRFDMITEFNFSHRLMNATVNFHTPNKTLVFSSWNQGRLRRLLEYTQQRVLEMRQQNHMSQQFQAAAAAQYAQMHAANYYQQPQQVPSYTPNLALQGPAEPQNQPQYQSQQPAPAPSQPQYEPYNPDNFQNGQGGGTASGASMGGQGSGPSAQASPTPTPASPATPQQLAAPLMSRFAAKRTALGTYTRSKLPSFRHHHDKVDHHTPAPQSGEVYMPGQPINMSIPLEY